MGIFVMKVDRDPAADRYIEWSTVVDDWTFLGTREEVMQHLAGAVHRVPRHVVDGMFRVVDDIGSSSRLDGRWDGDDLFHPYGRLPRERLPEYVDALERYGTGVDRALRASLELRTPELLALLDPHDDWTDADCHRLNAARAQLGLPLISIREGAPPCPTS